MGLVRFGWRAVTGVSGFGFAYRNRMVAALGFPGGRITCAVNSESLAASAMTESPSSNAEDKIVSTTKTRMVFMFLDVRMFLLSENPEKRCQIRAIIL